MKKLSRLKTSLSLLLVATLAATIMPTSVNAETTEFADNEVTVEVDFGPGGPDQELCEGFASLDVPSDTMTATLNRRVNGIVSPTVLDVLAYWWGEYDFDDNSAGIYDNGDLQNSMNILNNTAGYEWAADWNAVTDPEAATVDNLISITYVPIVTDSGTLYRDEDIDTDGDIDASDAPDWITETRRNYSTNWFTVSYDANDCVESDDMAVVLVARAPVYRAEDAQSTWANAEIDYSDNWSPIIENRAEAYLRVRTNLIGGLISLPNTVAWDWTADLVDYEEYDVDPIAFGDEGSAQMRSMMNIYGASPTGIYQANYYYQLEVNAEEYFYDEFGFFGCYYFGGCF